RKQERLLAIKAEKDSRVAAARLEVAQLTQQLEQNRVQLANAKKIVSVNEEIQSSLGLLMEEGAYGRVPYMQQEQETHTSQAEAIRLTQEENRLRLTIAQAEEQLQNTIAGSRDDMLTRIATNEKRIAEIDSELTKVIVENEKRIQEIDSQISQTEMTLDYQDLRAPVSGTVFELEAASPGYVYNTSEPVLKIVPEDNLVARVAIKNADIGFVEPGMPVDVRIDSFPYREFGDVKGELVHIGSDALPPDQMHNYYRFPAEIRLDEQSLDGKGEELLLQSGMSLNVNIKTRKRSIMSIFLSKMFSEGMDSIRHTR
ncbi:MAG: HlyD family efflux transporter periplasmic adaptor subunit, partial [Cyanothece sp. SIO1E1]|nr:HlyD family efflux transporter periplasmic adaptor subunit [Cyanothece sp. SIO1E1]